MKYKPQKPLVKTREATPMSRRTKKGVDLLCPFCHPTHTLAPNKPSACGTVIRVVATQYLISARTAKNKGVICLKCHKDSGGDMAQCQNGYIHVHDCAPGTVIMTQQPDYSKLAELVFKLPVKLREQFEKKLGSVKEIAEIDADGKETGKILGYFFYKPE